jgi:hypothetical protein
LRAGRDAIEHTDGMDGLEAVRLLGVTLQRLSFSPHRRMRRRTVAVEAIAIREAMGDTTGAARTREVFEQIGLAIS